MKLTHLLFFFLVALALGVLIFSFLPEIAQIGTAFVMLLITVVLVMRRMRQ